MRRQRIKSCCEGHHTLSDQDVLVESAVVGPLPIVAGSHARVRAEGRTDGAHLDVAVFHARIRELGSQKRGPPGVLVAGPAVHPRHCGAPAGGIVRIQPQHVGLRIVPEGHHQHHATVQSFSHGFQATLQVEVIHIPEGFLHIGANFVGNRITSDPCNGHVGVGNHLAILDVEATDVDEVSVIPVAFSDELSDHRHLLAAVDLEVPGPTAVELLVAQTPGIEVAAVLVADSLVTFVLAVVATVNAFTNVGASDRAWVWRVGRGSRVRFPDIHLCTAGTVLADGRVVARIPADDIGLTLHKLQVMRALRIAVAGAIFGSGPVGAARLLGRCLAAVRVHLHEVDSTVEAAGHVEHVHGQGELSVLQLEDPVPVRCVHHVDSGTKV
mmetsp:Transcript_80711/g.164293  ORF Transcript_80711/g.164293 Transcript_80711/m.164293 type:complete len:383 (+) Transcript_80711:100-1248(+)